jgi:hypothetical protein
LLNAKQIAWRISNQDERSGIVRWKISLKLFRSAGSANRALCTRNKFRDEADFRERKLCTRRRSRSLVAHVEGNKASSNVVNVTLSRFFRAILREAFVFDCKRIVMWRLRNC